MIHAEDPLEGLVPNKSQDDTNFGDPLHIFFFYPNFAIRGLLLSANMKSQGLDLPFHQKTNKNHMKQWFSRQWTPANKEQWSQRYGKPSRGALQLPQLIAWGEIPSHGTERGNPKEIGGVPELQIWGWVSRRPRKLQLAEQQTRQEKVKNKKSYRDLQRVILQYLAESLSAHAHE